jgi:hypothetical protein
MAEGDPAPKNEVAAAEGEIREALASGAAREATALPSHLRHLHEHGERQDIELKKEYARWLRRALTGQLLVADVVFFIYAWAGKRWDLEPVVINIWLGATVIQVVGIVLVVTRHLFPQRDGEP